MGTRARVPMMRKPLKVEETICRMTWFVKASRYLNLVNDDCDVVSLVSDPVESCCCCCCCRDSVSRSSSSSVRKGR